MSEPEKTEKAAAADLKNPRQLLQVGFVPVRCPACNALVCNVSPGATLSTICRRCNRQILFCAPTANFLVDVSKTNGQPGVREP